MNDLFLLVFLLCFVALFIGLIKPQLVIRWGEMVKRNRKNVLKVYGIGLIVSFILFGVTIPPTETSEGLTEGLKDGLASTEEQTLEEKDAADRLSALNIDNKITALGEVDALTLDKKDTIYAIRAEYELLPDEQKGMVTKLVWLESADKKINFLQSVADKAEAEKIAAGKAEEEKVEAEAAMASEVEEATAGLSEADYKALCVDYSYVEVTKDDTTYVDTYIKKDFMVRSIATYTPTNETIYCCGENKGEGVYVGGLFYVFDRRSDKTQPIELYDKIYIYGKVKELHEVSTWTQSGIDPYIDAVYIEFNGKFGE